MLAANTARFARIAHPSLVGKAMSSYAKTEDEYRCGRVKEWKGYAAVAYYLACVAEVFSLGHQTSRTGHGAPNADLL